MAGLEGGGPGAAEVPVLLLVDTAGCDMEEQAAEDGDSKVTAKHCVRYMRGVCDVQCCWAGRSLWWWLSQQRLECPAGTAGLLPSAPAHQALTAPLS